MCRFIQTILIGCAFALCSHAQTILINEVMSSNGHALLDDDRDSPDWIELYNASTNTVDLTGWGLSDDTNQVFKWRFTHATIDPGQTFLVFASDKNRQPGDSNATLPDSLSGLQLWLDASTVNTNDATQARTSGSDVFIQQWNDQSGQAQNATQGNTDKHPRYIANPPGLNGHPTLRFDGINDELVIPSVLAENEFTLLVVARANNSHEIDPESNTGTRGVSGQRYLFGARHGGSTAAGMGVSMGTNGVSVYEHGAGYMPATAVSDVPLPGYAAISINYTNRTPALHTQGSLASAGIISARDPVRAPDQIGNGAYGAFDGDIAEILLYDRSLNEAERVGLEQYLSAKYDLGIKLYWHTNFKISSSGEPLILTRPGGTTSDSWPPTEIPRDISYGRQPDGGTNFVWFSTATPNAPNTTPGAYELLQVPSFSVPRGFFTHAFSLELAVTNSNSTIHYTLDGSEPTTNSPVYSTPLTIASRVGDPNTISEIRTAGGWAAPAGEVFKLNVVRARNFKPDAIASDTATHTYLIANETNRYSVPLISIATDADNFFDDDIGIYVPGNAPNGNYFQRGEAWERPMHIEFFENNGSLAFSQNAGIKIHGNTSRGHRIKSMDILADWQNEGAIEYRLFENRDRQSWDRFLLRQSGHDHNLTYFRDVMMHDLASELGMETQAARACVVFINGEYWGIHYLRERHDADYLATNGGVDPDQVDFLEGYASAREGDTAHYNGLIQFLNANDISNSTNYTTLRSMIEVDNYIDYKATEMWTYRWDMGNHRLWRPRTAEGRWRWIQFDNDVGWGGFASVAPAWEFDFLAYATEANGAWNQYPLNNHNNPTVTFLLRTLLENADFETAFANRLADLMNTTYHPSNTLARIDQYADRIRPEIAEHIARWRTPDSITTWSNNVEVLRTYANQRSIHMRQHLRDQLGLGNEVSVTLQCTDSTHGRIRINTVDITASTNAPWTGVYFSANPITISAKAHPGYRFVRWQELPEPQDTQITNTFAVSTGLTLTAQFEPLPGPEPFDLATGPYLFRSWPTNGPPGSFPPNMVFQQTAPDAAADPGIHADLIDQWHLSYNRTNRSRMIGLDDDGIAFINTGNVQADNGGHMGAALLALNTIGQTNLLVSWFGGTAQANDRHYGIRLQYRAGDSGPFTDLEHMGQPVEYIRNSTGDEQRIGPISLPPILLNQPHVELRWKYYWQSGTSGPRDMLRLDDITVTTPVPPPDTPPLTPVAGPQQPIRFNGVPGLIYRLEISDDLLHWTHAGYLTAGPNGGIEHLTEQAGEDKRYYRLVWP